MKAAAPGKLILSGAYAVLHGAPALVAAVDRYVIADSGAPASRVTPEVRATLGHARAPSFDASALREGDQKLGLGSSAAIAVASLAAVLLEREPMRSDASLHEEVFRRVLKGHREAQGGGSGVDVAASTYGGVLAATLQDDSLHLTPVRLPERLQIEVWFSGTSASTPRMLAAVDALAQDHPLRFRTLLARLQEVAHATLHSLDADGVEAFVDCLDQQAEALAQLGDAAQVPIVTQSVAELRAQARPRGSTVMPSGAGGGDSVLYAGTEPPGRELVELRDQFGYRPLALRLGARGVHALGPDGVPAAWNS
ncbi:MAG: hypothetical protein R3B13_30480 [Polyangiaceae bacterium]